MDIALTEADWTRFKAKTRNDGACIAWEGARFPTGYGAFRYRGKTGYAHRFVYEFFHGDVPDGLYVRHLCDNPFCVSPFHLEAGTPSQNHYDMKPEARRRVALEAHANRTPEKRKAHAAKMRAARTPEGIRRGALKMTAARIAKRNKAHA